MRLAHGVARHDQQLGVRLVLLQRRVQIKPVPGWHDHIGEHQVDVRVRLCRQLQGGGAVDRVRHLVAEGLQALRQGETKIDVVFYQQDALGAAARRSALATAGDTRSSSSLRGGSDVRTWRPGPACS